MISNKLSTKLILFTFLETLISTYFKMENLLKKNQSHELQNPISVL